MAHPVPPETMAPKVRLDLRGLSHPESKAHPESKGRKVRPESKATKENPAIKARRVPPATKAHRGLPATLDRKALKVRQDRAAIKAHPATEGLKAHQGRRVRPDRAAALAPKVHAALKAHLARKAHQVHADRKVQVVLRDHAAALARKVRQGRADPKALPVLRGLLGRRVRPDRAAALDLKGLLGLLDLLARKVRQDHAAPKALKALKAYADRKVFAAHKVLLDRKAHLARPDRQDSNYHRQNPKEDMMPTQRKRSNVVTLPRTSDDPNLWFEFGTKEPDRPVRIAILTSWDLPRLERAIRSVKRQKDRLAFWVEINSQDEKYIVQATDLCKKIKADCHISKSTGTAGVGKQAVFDQFIHRFTEPFLYLLDGDDWLYPCASLSIGQTVKQYSSLDVLTYPALDVIQGGGGWYPIAPGAFANFWNGQMVALNNWEYGPGPAHWLWASKNVITGPGRTVLFSRKAAEELRWHPTIGCYEDTLLLLDSLALHQKGEMTSVVSVAQDTFIYDLTTPEGGQKKNDLVKASIELRYEAQQRVHRDRSSVGELPLLYQESRITYEEKIEYAKKTYKKGK